MSDKFLRARDACIPTEGHSWFEFSYPSDNRKVYRLSLLRCQSDSGNSYYTWVGADEAAYRLLERIRVKNHRYLVRVPTYDQVYRELLDSNSQPPTFEV